MVPLNQNMVKLYPEIIKMDCMNVLKYSICIKNNMNYTIKNSAVN